MNLPPGGTSGRRTCQLLTLAQSAAADAAAIAAGVPGIELMENAGAAAANVIQARFAPRSTLVLCGPGNNGGDGFVVARRLHEEGWPVTVALLGRRDRLKGDAALAAARWSGEVRPCDPELLGDAALVVDALFGAGLSRPLDGMARAMVEALAARRTPVVAIDMPSGVDGDSGEIRGAAAPAAVTVTFHRAKPGHFLLPGRDHVGALVVADIGIPDAVTEQLDLRLWANQPALWWSELPRRRSSSHKYAHGHAVVLGGQRWSSGAGRMAARAALRAGAGLVTVLCPEAALDVHASQLTAVMVAPFANDDEFGRFLADQRRNGILLGPGAGVGEALRRRVALALQADKRCVLDADALTSFAAEPEKLFELTRTAPCILTPHEGEFRRIFKHEGDKLTRTLAAASECGATVLLKGADTVIAAPDGRAVIQPHAPPSLATAGSGDVLAGIILGLLVQGMTPFQAAAAGTWLHAAAAAQLGAGLIAEDLIEALPRVLDELAA